MGDVAFADIVLGLVLSTPLHVPFGAAPTAAGMAIGNGMGRDGAGMAIGNGMGRDGAGMAIGTGTAVATGVWRKVASLSALRRHQGRHGWSSGISSVTPPEPPRRLQQAPGTTDARRFRYPIRIYAFHTL
jgi:hypothetical protein